MKIYIYIFSLISFFNLTSYAANNSEGKKLPIPRFVTIKSSEVNARTGPNFKYPIKWIFKNKGEPVEIIAQWEHWRRIKDITGEDSWVHESMVKGSRAGIIISKEPQYSYNKPDINSKKTMLIEPQVRVKLLSCKPEWCQIKIETKKSWILKKNLWGVYNDEEFFSK